MPEFGHFFFFLVTSRDSFVIFQCHLLKKGEKGKESQQQADWLEA